MRELAGDERRGLREFRIVEPLDRERRDMERVVGPDFGVGQRLAFFVDDAQRPVRIPVPDVVTKSATVALLQND